MFSGDAEALQHYTLTSHYRIELNFILITTLNIIFTLTEYNKYIIVTVEILSKPLRAYDEDHQDM